MLRTEHVPLCIARWQCALANELHVNFETFSAANDTDAVLNCQIKKVAIDPRFERFERRKEARWEQCADKIGKSSLVMYTERERLTGC